MAIFLLLESRNAASSFSHPRLNLSHNTSVLNYSQVAQSKHVAQKLGNVTWNPELQWLQL